METLAMDTDEDHREGGMQDLEPESDQLQFALKAFEITAWCAIVGLLGFAFWSILGS